jgi:AcrR family transcriptional regulator
MTKHVSDRREVLLNAATTLFRENGYNKTTVRQLALQSGIKSGSIFHHFDSKEEILFAVIERVAISLRDVMKEKLLKADTVEKEIYILIRTSLEFAFEDPQIADAYAVSYRDYQYLTTEHQKKMSAYNTEYRLMLTEVFIRAQKESLIANDPGITFHFLNGAVTHAPKWFRTDGALNIDQLADEFYKMVVK